VTYVFDLAGLDYDHPIYAFQVGGMTGACHHAQVIYLFICQGFTLAKQLLYCLSHTSSPMLSFLLVEMGSP
jgi:hypothetical protein